MLVLFNPEIDTKRFILTLLKVLVKNAETGIQRIAQAVVLDPPETNEGSNSRLSLSRGSHSSTVLHILPSCTFPASDQQSLDREVAYISPLLAFNLDLHVSCLKSLVRGGEKALASYFKDKVDDEICGKGTESSVISLQLEPLALLPRYASHLRVSFVKIPECGTLESLKGSSPVEAEDRQELIDLALQKYFEVDRYLARGDVFSVYINWNCNSSMCIPCSQSMQDRSDGIIYFKVTVSIFLWLRI